MPVSPSAEANLLSHRETAQRLGIHPNTLTSWVKRGWLAAVRRPSDGEACFRGQDVVALRELLYAE